MKLKNYTTKDYISWRRARVAGGLLLRYENGTITPARKKILKSIVSIPGVSNRLIDQGVAYHVGRKNRLRLVKAA